MAAEHGPCPVHLRRLDAQERKDQAGRDRRRGDEPHGHRVPHPPVVIGAPLDALDRGQLRADRGAQAAQHPPGRDGLGGQAHRVIQRGVKALRAQRRDEQPQIGDGFRAAGQFQLQVAELVGDAFQRATAGPGRAVGGFEVPEQPHVGVSGLADSPQLGSRRNGLHRGDEDAVLDEVGLPADHAHVRADRGQPPRAAAELGRAADCTVFLAAGQVGAVDQPLDQVLAVISIRRRRMAEYDLVAFRKKTMTGAGAHAEFDGQAVYVLLNRCLTGPHVSDVAVFEQVDSVDQLAAYLQADHGDDLP
jgi:hypothetical protein